jgi:RND superfamily putative drug exporter
MGRLSAATGKPTLSGLVVAHRKAVLIVWVALASLCLPFVLDVGDRLVVAGEVPGGEATAVESRIDADFARDRNRLLALVLTGLTDPVQAQDLGTRIAEELKSKAWIGSVEVRAVDPPASDALILVRLTDALEDAVALGSLKAAVGGLLARENRGSSTARANWTGELAVRAEIIEASTQDLRRSEIRALPLSFLILCLAFGAVVAALLPLAVGLVAMLLTLALAGILADYVSISIMVQSVASLLGLALGIDYALLVISQFRKELAAASDASAAAVRTLENCGKTVLVSGAAVSIGFAGLALVPVDNLRSIGIAGMGVAVFAALATTTALPAVLSWLGEGIDRGRLWRRRAVEASAPWYRWAAYVCDHPWRIVFASAVPLLALGLHARDLEATFPSDGWLPADAESIEGLTRLKELGEAGALNRLLVLYELPEGVVASQPAAGPALRRLHIALNRDARTASVISAASFGLGSPALVRAPAAMLNAYRSADGRSLLIELTPAADLDTGNELTSFVRDIRSIDVQAVTALGGRISVGGTPAATADYEDLVDYWLPRVIALVALGSFLALAFAFRSLVIPVKAVLLNVLAVFAAYGAIVLIFVDGFGVNLFGLMGPVEGVFPPTPIIVFCAAFGISMDYEVFLLSSIAGARAQGRDDRASIIEGIARSGRVITSAAAIMVVVFGAFAFGEVLPTQILGTALAIVVAIDALLIRMALGPAMIRVAGRWNWWPGSG